MKYTTFRILSSLKTRECIWLNVILNLMQGTIFTHIYQLETFLFSMKIYPLPKPNGWFWIRNLEVELDGKIGFCLNWIKKITQVVIFDNLKSYYGLILVHFHYSYTNTLIPTTLDELSMSFTINEISCKKERSRKRNKKANGKTLNSICMYKHYITDLNHVSNFLYLNSYSIIN